MDWRCVSLQYSYDETFTCNVMVFRGETFGRYLGLDEAMRVGGKENKTHFLSLHMCPGKAI